MTADRDPSTVPPAPITPNTQASARPLSTSEDEGARLLAELGVDPAAGDAGSAPPEASGADEEFMTPLALIRYSLERHGRTLEESRLPETLIATFQRSMLSDLVAATGASQAPQVPADVARVAQGKAGDRDIALVKLGIGAPAAVTVLEELIALGARRILVVGTGGSIQPALPIGSLIVPTGAIREDGASFHYAPAGAELGPDADLARALGEAAAQHAPVAYGPVWTTDAPYRELRSKVTVYSAMGALAVEMEAAALFALAAFRGVRLALLLAISDELFHEWRPGFHADELRLAQAIAVRSALAVAARDLSHPS